MFLERKVKAEVQAGLQQVHVPGLTSVTALQLGDGHRPQRETWVSPKLSGVQKNIKKNQA